MAIFRRTIPNQETKLRQWPAGRVNQLKLFLSHLRTAMDNSLAAQVQQTFSRKFTEFLPKITTHDLIIEVNYHEIRFIYKPPRGLRKFLFYEQDVSRYRNFSNFDRYQSCEPVFTFTELEPGFVYFFRLRVVSTDGEVGPWSETIEQAALRARASSVFDNRTHGSFVSRIATRNNWLDVLSITHPAVGGSIFYMCNFYIRPQLQTSPLYNLIWSDIEFRWTENGKQIGNTYQVTNYNVQGMRAHTGTQLGDDIQGTIDRGPFLLPGPLRTGRTGTFCQRLHQVQSGDIAIKLQARLSSQKPRQSGWLSTLDPLVTVLAPNAVGAFITIRNFSSFEYVLDS